MHIGGDDDSWRERGQSTAEYAVGVVGAACIGCILIECGQADWFEDLVRRILETAGGVPVPFFVPNVGAV